VEQTSTEWYRRRALMLLAHLLPDDLADQAVLLAKNFQNEQARAQTLAKYARRLHARDKTALLKDAAVIGDEASRSAALISLMKYLPLDSKNELVKYADELGEAGPRSQVFAALAEHFPESRVKFQKEALKTAYSIPEPHTRAWALLDLIPSLPEALRSEVIEEAFNATRMI
jgi:hypothetical protein